MTAARGQAVADWTRCRGCGVLLYRRRFVRDLLVCRECGHHAPLTAMERIDLLMDPGSVTPLPFQAGVFDPLEFTDALPYAARLSEARARTGLDEAVVCVRGTIEGHPLVAAVMDFGFMGGSLGSAAGELVTLTAEVALAERVPLLLVTASGGARMQEGVLSLMQMAKTSAARARLREARVPYIAVLLHPTTGGVAASVAMLGDVIIAEPDALIGFAGPRVIEQTIRQQLPPGFQRSEFLLEHGMVDLVVPRKDMKKTLERTLRWFERGRQPERRTGAILAVPEDAELPATD